MLCFYFFLEKVMCQKKKTSEALKMSELRVSRAKALTTCNHAFLAPGQNVKCKSGTSQHVSPPTGSLGLPVTNCKKSLCCSASKLLNTSKRNRTARLQMCTILDYIQNTFKWSFLMEKNSFSY